MAGLYDLTQWLFDKTEVALHKYCGVSHNLPAEVMAEGFIGGYLLTRGLQIFSREVVDRFFPGFDYNSLPLLEKITVVGLPIAAIMSGLMDEEYFTSIINNQAMDNLGILSAYIGGTIVVGRDLKKRRINEFKERIERLEEKLKE